jgi:hypothetical protein
LPGNIIARLEDLTQDEPLAIAVELKCARYARESKEDRLTLDVGVHTDIGKCLPYSVLEWKSSDAESAAPPGRLAMLVQANKLRPIKLSKFKWSLCP